MSYSPPILTDGFHRELLRYTIYRGMHSVAGWWVTRGSYHPIEDES